MAGFHFYNGLDENLIRQSGLIRTVLSLTGPILSREWKQSEST